MCLAVEELVWDVTSLLFLAYLMDIYVTTFDLNGFYLSRELLQRAEAVLRHLLQQELRKAESLKAAEAKVAKLREQLQASEKIVSANRMLLKKLQEQVSL